MNCNEIRDLLSLYIDDELDEDEKLLFEEHLVKCEDCQRELDEYKKIILALNDIPDEEPPLGYCKRLHEKLLNAEADKIQKAASPVISDISRKSKNKRFRWVKYGSLAAALVLVFLVYGMNNIGMKNSKSEIAYDYAQSTEQAAEAPMEPAAGRYDYDNKMDDKNKYGIAAEESAVASDEGQFSLMSVPEKEMKIIKSGSLSVQTDNYEKFTDELTNEVQFLGGYLENNNTEVYQIFENDEKLMYGNMKIRVPQESFYELVLYLENSSEVKRKNTSETDVTKEYYDKDNRVKNLEVQEQHLRELFEKAQTVEEMLLIEDELRRVRTEIDALNISLSDIDDRASMSTINLEVSEVLSVSLAVTSQNSVLEKAKEGFINTVNSIIRSAENFLIYIVSVSPLLIPALIILVVILSKVKKYIKMRKKL